MKKTTEPARDRRKPLSPERWLTVLLVDDHPALRAGLKSLFAAESGIRVVAEAGSGEEAVATYRAQPADVVVLDLSMAGFGGVEALRRILQHDPSAHILVYSVHASEIMLQRALALGALGYVTKASDAGILIRGLREVGEGKGFVSPDLVPAMVRSQASVPRSLLDRLSDREFTIFLLTVQGRKPAECAQAINLSEKTVRNHLTRIKDTLDVTDTAGLVRLAVNAGLVKP